MIILLYGLVISSILIFWSKLLAHLGKIDKTFLEWANQLGNYISVKYKKGNIIVESNS